MVALLAEGVDRNTVWPPLLLLPQVALLAEGVDRNVLVMVDESRNAVSPSSRRAWIEM